jgi:hypothetical protein
LLHFITDFDQDVCNDAVFTRFVEFGHADSH